MIVAQKAGAPSPTCPATSSTTRDSSPPPRGPSPHPSPNLHLQRSHPHQGPTMSASFPQTNHNPLAKVTFTHPRTFPPSTVCRCPFSFKSACATFLTCPPTHSGPSAGVQMMPCRKALRESDTLLSLTRPRTRFDIPRHPCPAVMSSQQPAHLSATMSVEVNSQTFSVTHSAFWSRTRELTSLSLFFKEARPQKLAKNPHRSAVLTTTSWIVTKRPRPANRFLASLSGSMTGPHVPWHRCHPLTRP